MSYSFYLNVYIVIPSEFKEFKIPIKNMYSYFEIEEWFNKNYESEIKGYKQYKIINNGHTNEYQSFIYDEDNIAEIMRNQILSMMNVRCSNNAGSIGYGNHFDDALMVIEFF